MTTFKARIVAALLPLLAVAAVSAAPAMASFDLEKLVIGAQSNQAGAPAVQAGEHPYALTTTFTLTGEGSASSGGRYLKDASLQLPPGFVGDPNATPKCTYGEFTKGITSGVGQGASTSCLNDATVGVATTYGAVAGSPGTYEPISDPVYNLVPQAGVAAEFGYIVFGRTPILLETSVRTGTDYGLTTNVSDINQAIVVGASKVTIWGVPADPAHDPIRGKCLYTGLQVGGKTVATVGGGLGPSEAAVEGPISPVSEGGSPVRILSPEEKTSGCPSSAPRLPLLTNPTSCDVPRTAKFSVDSWEEQGSYLPDGAPDLEDPSWRSVESSLPELLGCEGLDFSPTLTVKPDLPDASTSSGLTVDVKVPQESTENPVGVAEADVRDTTVMLPAGVALNPAGANGLESCSSNPGALSADQLGSLGDGIGFKGFEESRSEPGVRLPIFSQAVPGSIAANDAVSTGSIAAGENMLQPGLNFCASASKIGTVRIKTPLLEHELTGTVYLAAQEANPFGSLMAMYVIAEEPERGVLVKLPGEVSLCKGAGEVIAGQTCQALGQVVTTLLNTPQLPFEEFEAHFFGGEKAPLTTPERCGTYSTDTSFVSWSGATKNVSAPFAVTNGPNGSACPGLSLPFSPSLTGGALNIDAGAFSPLTLTMGRADGEQNMQSVEAHLPAGLSGILSSVELCPEPQANLGECGPNSLIGETTVSVGVGGDPYTVTGGKFYVTGPYNGTGACTVGQAGCAPFGITFTVPAKAGPFDLAHTKSFSPPCDCILVRGKIEVNPITTALTVTSNPPGTPDAIPTSIEGIPLQIQKINATTTRGNFQFNPTNCSKMEVTGTIHSSEGGTDTIGVPFQVTNCASLKFEPKFSASTRGQASKADGASLNVKIAYPAGVARALGSQAWFRSAKFTFPKQLPARLTTLQKACVSAVFEANPAACPPASDIGHATVHTPLLSVPVEGPVYFVSYGGAKFPEAVLVLQGEGVTVDLHGETFISNSGVTSATFRDTPDVPFESIEVSVPSGPYSEFGSDLPPKDHYNFCGQALKMPTAFVAQNGLEINQDTAMTVTGCAKAKTLTRADKLTAALKACHKDKNKNKLAACERTARKKYGPVKKKAKKK